jgi:hypothetical protein
MTHLTLLAPIAVLALQILGWVMHRYRVLNTPLSLIGLGPPWDMRFVPWFVGALVLIVWILAPHSHFAKTISDLVSGWFR